MRTEEEIIALMQKSIEALRDIFNESGKLRIPETDQIVEMIYSYFFHTSISSLPAHLRHEYIKDRINAHGEMLTESVNGSLGMIANKPSKKESIH